jgi:hypothetical protein
MVMIRKDKPSGPLLGAHMSIAGGVGNALLDGKKVDCDAIRSSPNPRASGRKTLYKGRD